MIKLAKFFYHYYKNKITRDRIRRYKNRKTNLISYAGNLLLNLYRNSTNDQFIIDNNKSYEVVIQKLLKSMLKKNDCVLDIGANIGAHTVFMSKLVTEGIVYAFEPDKLSYKKLNTNIALNGCNNVKLIKLGIHNESDHLDFFSSKTSGKSDGNNSLHMNAFAGSSLSNDEIQSYKIEVTTIDIFVEKEKIKPDFIKIDIEGNELKAFQGMTATIKKYKPTIIFEYGISYWWPLEDRSKFEKLLSPFYDCYIINELEAVEYPRSYFYKKPEYFSLDPTDLINVEDDCYILCIDKNKFLKK